MLLDPRCHVALAAAVAAAVFAVWAGYGAGLHDAAMAAGLWGVTVFFGGLVLEDVLDDRDRGWGFFDHLMTPISALALAVASLGRTGPALLNAVYAVPEDWRGERMPYQGLFDADWWNAPWVVPTALGVSLALAAIDLFVRGPLRGLVIGGIARLVLPFTRRW